MECTGRPNRGALLTAGFKGLQLYRNEEYSRVDEIPFESEYKYMATLNEFKEGKILIMKGSIESVLSRCFGMYNDQNEVVPLDNDVIVEVVEKYANNGLRVLAFCSKELAKYRTPLSYEELNTGMIFF